MSDDGFVWMNEAERRDRSGGPSRAAGPSGPRRASRSEPPRLVLSDEGWEPAATDEPSLRFIGEQLGLWFRWRWRRARREVPRWALDKLAERILPAGAIR